MFTASGPKQQIVSAFIFNDTIALEADEVVDVELTIISPSPGVTFGTFPNTVVKIADDDRKCSALKQCHFAERVS